MSRLESLQTTWKTLYTTTLPTQAKSKSPAQPHWPVTQDHCFARIILDNAIGVSRPWTAVLASPAWRHMDCRQLEDAIALGRRVELGLADLVALDCASLELRGKRGKGSSSSSSRVRAGVGGRVGGGPVGCKGGSGALRAGKRKRGEDWGDGDVSRYFAIIPKHGTGADAPERGPGADHVTDAQEDDTGPAEIRVADPITGQDQKFAADADPVALIDAEQGLSAFRKRVLKLLCQVPRGRYTTYAAIADAMNSSPDQDPRRGDGGQAGDISGPQKMDKTGKTSKTSATGKTCARAIGSAMRNNPFAPLVPCHRVLATGGKIGGFGGEWGDDGKYAARKREMLREEGVRFDGKGKVVGGPFTGFAVD